MNKSSRLFRIAGTLAIILGSIYCMGFMLIFPVLIGICLIFGGIKFMDCADLNSQELEKHTTSMIVWIIVFFILGCIITGIIALIAYLDSKENMVYNNNVSDAKIIDITQNIENNGLKKSEQVIEKLERISKLYKEGLLTEEEYTNLKNELLKK